MNGIFHIGIINKWNVIENCVSNVLWKMIQVEEDILKFLKSQHAQQSWRKNVNETERSWSRTDFIYILNVKVKQKKPFIDISFYGMANWLRDFNLPRIFQNVWVFQYMIHGKVKFNESINSDYSASIHYNRLNRTFVYMYGPSYRVIHSQFRMR